MIAVGTDILEVDRMRKVLDRMGDKFARRILRPDEWQAFSDSAQPHRLLAKRFAAKEAVAKTLGTGIGRGVSWQDICIRHTDDGAPQVELSGGALDVARRLGGEWVAISIADEREYVVAFAVLS